MRAPFAPPLLSDVLNVDAEDQAVEINSVELNPAFNI